MAQSKDPISQLGYIKQNHRIISPLAFSSIAQFYSEPKNEHELIDTLEFAYKRGLEVSILGSGTHTLLSDYLIPGIVISTTGMRGITKKGSIVEACPGEMLDWVIDKTIEHQLVGLERLAGIPGTIAGALCCNASANGTSLSDYVFYFDYITLSGKMRRQACYKDTFSKNKLNMREKGIITSIALKLDLSKATAEAKLRKRMYVELMFIPPSAHAAGKVFFDSEGFSADSVIKSLGSIGNKMAEFSLYQPNCIFTYPGCTADDISTVIKMAEDKAKDELGIKLNRALSEIGSFRYKP